MEYDLKKIQSMLLEMYHDFYCLTESKGWDLFLVGGSALGAVRHKGFIPWDDDMDAAMLRADFEKMERFFAEQNGRWGEYIYLPAENTIYPSAPIGHVYQRKQAEKYGFANALKLDIHPLDGIPKSRFLQKVQNIGSYVYYLYAYDHPTKNKGKLMHGITKTILFLTPDFLRKYFLVKLKRLITGWNTGEEQELCSLFGVASYSQETLPRSVVLPARSVPFEQYGFKVFGGVEEYLSQRYGDYMALPPESERKPSHEAFYEAHPEFGQDET